MYTDTYEVFKHQENLFEKYNYKYFRMLKNLTKKLDSSKWCMDTFIKYAFIYIINKSFGYTSKR